jgi:hypothetical protein
MESWVHAVIANVLKMSMNMMFKNGVTSRSRASSLPS